MKPLCDNPSYCKTDEKSVYIGQTNHIAHKPHRDIDSYFPDGWSELKEKFPQTFCTYTAKGNGNNALCTTGAGHAWKSVADNKEIVCARAPPYKQDPPFEGDIGDKNLNIAGLWKFQRVRTFETGGNFDEIMIDEC